MDKPEFFPLIDIEKAYTRIYLALQMARPGGGVFDDLEYLRTAAAHSIPSPSSPLQEPNHP